MPDPTCCLLAVCCPHPLNATAKQIEAHNNRRAHAFAELVKMGFPDVGLDKMAEIGAFLLTKVGFVPLGVDVALVGAYEPYFNERGASAGEGDPKV